MKKILALLLAMAMVLGMSVTSLAAPNDGKTAKITVKGTEGEQPAELKYLQIIVADQTTETGWAFASDAIEGAYLAGYNGEDGELGAQEVIQELIAARKDDGYANNEAIGRALSHVAALDGFTEMSNPQPVSSAGVYAVKAVQEGFIYNNMAAYVGFREYEGEYPVLQDAELQAKRTPISLEKSHDDADKVSGIGDIVTYTIKTYVPYIDPSADNKTYYIYDEISGARYNLDPQANPDAVLGTITLADEELNGYALECTAPKDMANQAFRVNLSNLIDDMNSNAGKELVITYTARITALTVDNKANAGHLSGDEVGKEYGDDDDKVFSGKITLTKTNEEETEKLAGAGFEVTDANDDVVYFTKDDDGVYTRVAPDELSDEIKTNLTDEQFEYEYNNKIYVKQVFTKEDGTIVVNGLNVGTYKFTEKTAPEGYSVNETPAEAVLEVTEENGVEDENGNLVANEVLSQETSMKDTRLGALPSTGGIGTTIFTIGGCALMILAAALYFATRRKTAK